MKKILFAMNLSLAALALPAHAAVNVLACEPEWAALATELGGDKVKASSATTALQDPHRIEARPSLIARARNAELMVCTGAQLEIGWVPLLQGQPGKPNIRGGQSGYFEAASVFALLERPTSVDRAQGDVHPAGNPHLHLNPHNIERVASALIERMAAIDAREAQNYRSRGDAFLKRWREATARWEAAGVPLKGMGVVTYHKNLT